MRWNTTKQKYGARATESVEGEKFDSVKEMTRYNVLTMLQTEGEIYGLRRQVKIKILPKIMGRQKARTARGVRWHEYVDERAVYYTADFAYRRAKDGLYILEEVKSVATRTARDYPIRRKLVKMRLLNHNSLGRGQWKFEEYV